MGARRLDQDCQVLEPRIYLDHAYLRQKPQGSVFFKEADEHTEAITANARLLGNKPLGPSLQEPLNSQIVRKEGFIRVNEWRDGLAACEGRTHPEGDRKEIL